MLQSVQVISNEKHSVTQTCPVAVKRRRNDKNVSVRENDKRKEGKFDPAVNLLHFFVTGSVSIIILREGVENDLFVIRSCCHNGGGRRYRRQENHVSETCKEKLKVMPRKTDWIKDKIFDTSDASFKQKEQRDFYQTHLELCLQRWSRTLWSWWDPEPH